MWRKLFAKFTRKGRKDAEIAKGENVTIPVTSTMCANLFAGSHNMKHGLSQIYADYTDFLLFFHLNPWKSVIIRGSLFLRLAHMVPGTRAIPGTQALPFRPEMLLGFHLVNNSKNVFFRQDKKMSL